MPSHLHWPALLLLISPLMPSAAEWRRVDVPGAMDFAGHGWYRAWLKPHDSFFAVHERDLFGESVVLNVRGLAGAHELFVNGRSIGTGGGFPPAFQDGREGNHRHKIPPGTLVQDRWNEVVFHVYNPSPPAGFTTEAPFVMNYFWECDLEGVWEFREGEDAALSEDARVEEPSVAAYNAFHESNRVLGEAENLVHGDKLPPEESVARLTAAEDLAVDLLLHEPLVAQPVHLSFDERGRLWVAQYRQYPYPAGLKMLSRDRYYRSHYDKTPPPPPHHDRGRDRISIHEDTDGDGRYDRHKVFQDGLNLANAALRGRGGVWVMHTPYLLFYPDENFDDVPDGPPVMHLRGFGFEDTHAVANGLVWGMDGWLYGAQGSTTSCRVTRPGLDPPDAEGVYFEGCMVWRYHPESRDFELFAEGGGNNFGLELDAQGRLFTGHNGGQTRGFHYVQGGLYQMQGLNPGKFGPPRNPYAFGDLPMMRNEQPIQRFTHFAALVEGTALPAHYADCFFALDPIHSFIMACRRKAVGATFQTSDMDKVLTSTDDSFRPVYIVNAPDGSMMLADFYEHYIAHGQHYQSQIDPTTGRIYRLRGPEHKLETDLNLAVKTTDDLIGLLGHSNKWHRHMAVRLLGERKDPRSQEALRELIERGTGLPALNAMWAHYQTFGADDVLASMALRQDYPPLRYWTIRLACDDGEVSSGLMDAIEDQARYEDDAEVRSQLAASARRLPARQALRLIRIVMSREEDVEDAYVPLLCWWVLESKFEEARHEVMGLFEEEAFWKEPMVQEHVLSRMMRLLALKARRSDYLDAAQLLNRAPDTGSSVKLMEGFEQAFAGRSMTGLPRELIEALHAAGKSSLIVRLRLGDESALPEAWALLADERADEKNRADVARTLGELGVLEAVPHLLNAALADGPKELRRACLAALTVFPDENIGRRVTGALETIPEELRAAAFELLLSRAAWTKELRAALDDERLTVALVGPEVVRRLSAYDDLGVRAWAQALWPAADASSTTDRRLRVAQTEAALRKGTGNPYRGESIFAERCAACHKLFFKGGEIGPDLTSYQRDDLGTMLTSILDPSAEIREGYQYVSVAMADGRALSGFLTDDDSRVVTLRGLSGEDVRLVRRDIESIQPVGRSLMPEGLLEGLSDEELRDLFAYLRISQPIAP